jgi:hypothetical protein
MKDYNNGYHLKSCVLIEINILFVSGSYKYHQILKKSLLFLIDFT